MTQMQKSEGSGGRVVVLTVLALALLVGGGYAAAYVLAGDNVPRGAEVAGIAIGGKSHDEAVAVLERGFAARAAIKVEVDGKPATVQAATAGLSVDYESSVEAAGGGRSWDPGRLWDYYTGGSDLEPVVRVDETALEEALVALDGRFGTPPKEGDVVFKDGGVNGVAAADGTEIDRLPARDALVDAFVHGVTAELELVKAKPDIDQADVQNGLNEFGNPAVSAPVTVVFAGTRVKLAPKDYTAALGMKPDNGVLVPELDGAKLAELVSGAVAASNGAPVDATVRLVNGKPEVVPDKPGVDYSPEDLTETFLQLVAAPAGAREGAVTATVKEAAFKTADAQALKIVERVSTFTTQFPHAAYRNTNIGRAAQLVNGTVLRPGDTFSLNGVVGERTAENGFTKGFIISDGVFREELGGGVSQMATTTFNAMFFAGLKDVEHKPHSFYIDRYPVGREATVAWPSVDLKFTNDTPYGVLIQASLSPSTPSRAGRLTVSMWSTKHWDITTKTGARYAFTQPKTRTLYGPTCVDNTGYGGFDIDIWRYFRLHGSPTLVRSEKMHTRYTPSDTVVCKPIPTPTPSPSPTPTG